MTARTQETHRPITLRELVALRPIPRSSPGARATAPSRAGDEVASDLAHRRHARECERECELVAEEGVEGAHAFGAAGRERPDERPPDEDGARAERQGTHHVDACANAAVDVDLRALPDGIGDVRKRV